MNGNNEPNAPNESNDNNGINKTDVFVIKYPVSSIKQPVTS